MQAQRCAYHCAASKSDDADTRNVQIGEGEQGGESATADGRRGPRYANHRDGSSRCKIFRVKILNVYRWKIYILRTAYYIRGFRYSRKNKSISDPS